MIVFILLAALLLIALAGRILDAVDDAFDEDAKGPRVAVINPKHNEKITDVRANNT